MFQTGLAYSQQQLNPTNTKLCDDFYSKLYLTKAQTIDQFLEELMKDPNFKKSVKAKSLFYKSRAMHGTSLENPRALIMFGMGDLTLAFNGSPEQAFYNHLEISCYNRNKSTFEFRAIEFPNKKAEEYLSESDVELLTSNNLRITKANPESCQKCHGSNNKPVWGSYLAWPGSFGSYEESYYVPYKRFAYEENNLETKKLTEFMAAAKKGKERYKHFHWGYSTQPELDTVESALFGILVNYKMSHAALSEALNFLKAPEKNKYKYAFVGHLLNCDKKFINYKDGQDLDDLVKKIATDRAVFELNIRKVMANDLAALGETLVWKDTRVDSYPFNYDVLNFKDQPSGLRQMVTRVSRHIPDWIKKITMFERLYNTMGLNTDLIHLTKNSKTSWDGYNEIQDYMADYLLKYYGLPEIVPIQKRAVEAPGVHRMDLETRLNDEDFASMKPLIDELAIPGLESGNKDQICESLSKQSLSATK